jgi:histidinol-phosphate aminotransferase
VEAMRRERDRITLRLREIPGLQVYDSESNFVLFRVVAPDVDHRALFTRLLEDHGVLVRDVSGYPMLERCLRVNAGTPEENDAFLAGVEMVLSGGATPATQRG